MPYRDKEAQRKSNRDSYARNKERVGAKVKEYKTNLRAEWQAYKSTLVCTVCGESDPATLDFHHAVRDPTNRKLSDLLRNGAYKDAHEEIKKCVVLCANCHRKGHSYERNGTKNLHELQKFKKYFRISERLPTEERCGDDM